MIQEASSSFGGKIATSIGLVSTIKWGLLMVLLESESNDDRGICMTFFQ